MTRVAIIFSKASRKHRERRYGWKVRAEMLSVDSSRAVAARESMPREREPRESVAPEPQTASADERRKRFERVKRGR